MSEVYFRMDRVKTYLDSVLATEDTLKTYTKVAEDFYRVYNDKPHVNIKDLEQYLKCLPINVASTDAEAELKAKLFAKDITSLTCNGRSRVDVYWWALATGFWVYAGMETVNPAYINTRP